MHKRGKLFYLDYVVPPPIPPTPVPTKHPPPREHIHACTGLSDDRQGAHTAVCEGLPSAAFYEAPKSTLPPVQECTDFLPPLNTSVPTTAPTPAPTSTISREDALMAKLFQLDETSSCAQPACAACTLPDGATAMPEICAEQHSAHTAPALKSNAARAHSRKDVEDGVPTVKATPIFDAAITGPSSTLHRRCCHFGHQRINASVPYTSGLHRIRETCMCPICIFSKQKAKAIPAPPISRRGAHARSTRQRKCRLS